MHPLVSCIMPTADRRRFVPLAIQYFLHQDYPNKELIIVDDGQDPVGDLIPASAPIRYVHEPQRRSVGAKRNLACQQARGDVIVHWDDDDWSAPWRLTYQVDSLMRQGADLCGLDKVLFWNPKLASAWEYRYQGGDPWVYGATFCYRKALWAGNRFTDDNVGEDTRFIWRNRGARVAALADSRFLVALVHSANTSPKTVLQRLYQPIPEATVIDLLGTALPAYRSSGPSLPAQVAPPTPPAVCPAPVASPERTIPMLTCALASDLQLPEFVAFNHGLSLPRMRRWELPFALYNARLGNTDALLDCTINPSGFGDRIARLYPHVLYRQVSPIQNGRFVLPLGVPDAAFDRITCINTLEHLLGDQRRQLVAALARKLKPDGRLLLTSDYYFDSSWTDPAFLRLGVMRSDRREVFNGWNKVTPTEWTSLCRDQGLVPVGDGTGAGADEPIESDPTLYRNQLPHAHATIGGVFTRVGAGPLPAGKKVMLALLTWNTRAISLESVQAYLREGRMLRRLGHTPLLCICDNGSTDGTPEALRALEPEIDFGYKLILNCSNRGNSIARNQIIDHAREAGADYVLFMDSDIEVVPFSSFAMLRHMENSGRQLGCVGADSAGQTPQRLRASPCFYAIERVETVNVVAWTQYGMFRREVFDEGVRFDESGPFDGAGWGYEDNDLAFQMETRGFANQRFFGMTYLHRDARSSVRILRSQGIDAGALCARRRQYVIDKWAAVPPINDGPLAVIRRFTAQV
jgi:glycosyltransferase involved in cell wall biosynthesis